MTCNFWASFEIAAVDHMQYFMVMASTWSTIDLDFRDFSPSDFDSIVLFVIGYGHWVMNDISDFVKCFHERVINFSFNLLHITLTNTFSASLILISTALTYSISSVHGSWPLVAFFFSATFLLAIPYSLLSWSKLNLAKVRLNNWDYLSSNHDPIGQFGQRCRGFWIS